MADRWRNSETSQAPEQARPFVEAHQRLVALASQAGLGPADAITHDLGRAEIRASWEDERLLLVVEEIGSVSAPPDPVRALR
jgi:hypothetical protein